MRGSCRTAASAIPRFSIIDTEWQQVKAMLLEKLARGAQEN